MQVYLGCQLAAPSGGQHLTLLALDSSSSTTTIRVLRGQPLYSQGNQWDDTEEPTARVNICRRSMETGYNRLVSTTVANTPQELQVETGYNQEAGLHMKATEVQGIMTRDTGSSTLWRSRVIHMEEMVHRSRMAAAAPIIWTLRRLDTAVNYPAQTSSFINLLMKLTCSGNKWRMRMHDVNELCSNDRPLDGHDCSALTAELQGIKNSRGRGKISKLCNTCATSHPGREARASDWMRIDRTSTSTSTSTSKLQGAIEVRVVISTLQHRVTVACLPVSDSITAPAIKELMLGLDRHISGTSPLPP